MDFNLGNFSIQCYNNLIAYKRTYILNYINILSPGRIHKMHIFHQGTF